eukprot:TRINITY_DN15821_c0_g3_i4.p1 TRINITY_DN15821_c0_g3~~TRINITY_DN15821_c0_g3_i4.p1  ORF type:complete len:238 (-),score=99.47 TRINITY_DN15821_c0_g3_i4:130-843(-)
MEQLLIRTIEGSSLFVDKAELSSGLVSALKSHLELSLGVPSGVFYLEQENKLLRDSQLLEHLSASDIYVKLRVAGGKGGFGSLLRGQAPKKKYTNNFSACRDLSGRRLRQVDNERRYAEWKQRKEEETKFVEREKKEYEAKKKELEDAIYANKYKIDDEYKRQLQKASKGIAAAVAKAVKQKKFKRKVPELSELDEDLDLQQEESKKFKEDKAINEEDEVKFKNGKTKEELKAITKE